RPPMQLLRSFESPLQPGEPSHRARRTRKRSQERIDASCLPVEFLTDAHLCPRRWGWRWGPAVFLCMDQTYTAVGELAGSAAWAEASADWPAYPSRLQSP